MKSKKVLGIIVSLLSVIMLTGCTGTKNAQISILATTDLHGSVPYHMVEYINKERKRDPNITLVDAGDFLDRDGYGQMDKYFQERRTKNQKGDFKDRYVEFPLANDMQEVGYDAVVLGNHEFVSNNRFQLDNMISDLEKNDIEVLSANTYKENGESYTKPYTIKEINVDGEVVKLGILGLTIKEVGEGINIDENGNRVESKSRELKDEPGYDGKLYMNDLVEDAKRWIKVMEKKENTDIIVAVAHSGEEPKNPKNPGNRIQDLAQNLEGIDAIVAGHTHVAFEQHDYKNKNGQDVIVTQPGKHGEYISKINFELKKENNEWKIENKYVKLKKFEEDKNDEYAGELMYKISDIKSETKEIDLSDITPFEYDKAYAFDVNTPISKIYDTVGYKFKSICEKEKESEIQMIFMKDDKVVCYLFRDTNDMPISINFDKISYKEGVIEINKNDKFSVEKGKEIFETHLTHI